MDVVAAASDVDMIGPLAACSGAAGIRGHDAMSAAPSPLAAVALAILALAISVAHHPPPRVALVWWLLCGVTAEKKCRAAAQRTLCPIASLQLLCKDPGLMQRTSSVCWWWLGALRFDRPFASLDRQSSYYLHHTVVAKIPMLQFSEQQPGPEMIHVSFPPWYRTAARLTDGRRRRMGRSGRLCSARAYVVVGWDYRARSQLAHRSRPPTPPVVPPQHLLFLQAHTQPKGSQSGQSVFDDKKKEDRANPY